MLSKTNGLLIEQVCVPGTFQWPDLREQRRFGWRRLVRQARDMVFSATDRIALLVPRKGARRGIAVVMPHALGDLLLFTPAFMHIRACFPHEPILLVCGLGGQHYAEAYLQPDSILVVDRARMRRDPLYRLRLLAAIGRAGARFAVQPGDHREHLIEDAFIRASRAEMRIGCFGSSALIEADERARGDRWYTHLVRDSAGALHETAYYARFVATVTGSAPAVMLPYLPRPGRHPDVPEGGYIVVACQASAALKTWPLEQFLTTALAAAAQTGLAVVVVGEAGRSVVVGPGVVDLCGQTDLPGLVSVLAHAELVLCNDSAPVHLAAALGVPAVAVGGGGIPERYLPYPTGGRDGASPVVVMVDPVLPCFGCGWRCHYVVPEGTAAPCVAQVPVERVLEAVLAVLGARETAGREAVVSLRA